VTPSAFVQLDAEGGWDAVLDALPASPGVGQFLAESDRHLLVGRASNLKRWAASHLGAPPRRQGARPRTDLRPVARALRIARASSPFHQLWLFERLMAVHARLADRRDLKPPAYLHLDAADRFPRLSVRSAGGTEDGLFGPFRDGKAASRAAEAVAKRFGLRPCDASFEPDPGLPLGLRCVYAQVRSCAAPCLARLSEDEYRALGSQAAVFLSHPDRRSGEPMATIPSWVTVATGRSLVLEPAGHCLELYPILGGAILDGEIRSLALEELGDALERLAWNLPDTAVDDRPWLLPWLAAKKRRGVYLALGEDETPAALADRIRGAVSPKVAAADE
jgi:hypothetical protein